MSPPTPCLKCGTPTPLGSYCANHQPPPRRRRPRPDLEQHAWRKLSKAAREAHPWCTLCGATTDLTLDHVQARTHTAGFQVLCRRCNARKGDRPA